VYEASALGAAIDAAVGLGLQPNVHTAVAQMTRVGRIFEPDAQAHQTYDLMYRRVYQHMYRTLKPLHEAIRQIASVATE
jgi:ribulose kinase